MKRIPEPELMDDPDQARAYAAADFTAPHDYFVELFQKYCPVTSPEQQVLDLGCGPADVTIRMARAYPGFRFHGIDGSRAMLHEGKQRIQQENLQPRIQLFHGILPDFPPPGKDYSLLISNSLLHHLHQPAVLWEYVKSCAATAPWLFIMDLARPDSNTRARELVNTYSGSEPEILKRDFYNSLCAAFTLEETREQILAAGLASLQVEQVTDRHLIIHGFVQNAL